MITTTPIDCCPHPYWARPPINGFSPGLKNMPPACFLPHYRWGRPLRIPSDDKKSPTTDVVGDFLAEDEGFEPPQTESESGVLPLHKSSMRILLYPSYPKSQEVFSCFAKKLLNLELLFPKISVLFLFCLPRIRIALQHIAAYVGKSPFFAFLC